MVQYLANSGLATLYTGCKSTVGEVLHHGHQAESSYETGGEFKGGKVFNGSEKCTKRYYGKESRTGHHRGVKEMQPDLFGYPQGRAETSCRGYQDGGLAATKQHCEEDK